MMRVMYSASILQLLLCCLCARSMMVELSFTVETACVCDDSYTLSYTLEYKDNEGQQQQVIDQTKPIKIAVNDFQDFKIEWRITNISSTIGDPCFSITIKKDGLPHTHRVNKCYSGMVYNKSWICSQNDSIMFSYSPSAPNGSQEFNGCASVSQVGTEGLPCERFTVCDSTLVEPNSTGILTTLSIANLSASSSPSSRLLHITPMPITSSITRTSPTPSARPTDARCMGDGRWRSIPAGTNVTLVGGCFNQTADAIRECSINGIWRKPQCIVSTEFSDTLDQIRKFPMQGLSTLSEMIVRPKRNVSLNQYVYLLDTVLQSWYYNNSNMTNMTDSRTFTREFVNATSNLIMVANSEMELDSDTRRSIGSQIMFSMEDLSLNVPDALGETITVGKEIFLKVTEYDQISSNDDDDIIGIRVDRNYIALPSELLKNREKVRIGSLFYDNLSYLLPPQDNESVIISSIISSTISCPSCGNISQLENNVSIHLHIENISALTGNFECVFYEFEVAEDSLPTGRWSTSGCVTSIDEDIVICSCNHLTNFAILLSPGVETSQIHYDILNIIGLILIPASLICMVIVILTYSLIRSLWTVRNYIHIMLCVSLCMAQLVFIVGIDKIKDEDACSAIAVLLQYFFLVSFMWMLMEGVILYVTLVRVFINNHKFYVIGFTIASYVIPAIYMSFVVPIGFLVDVDSIPGHTHFLYYVEDELTACWLNYSTGFVWSFIAPVVIILIVNVGFLLMAIAIMCRHLKKQNNNKNTIVTVRHWLKASISLTLVLGTTWLVGVLVFRRELLFVAYIVTIFIAGQGVWLFIILVPLSRQVREAYLKLWQRKRSKSRLLNKMITTVTSPLSVFSVTTNSTNTNSTVTDTRQNEHSVMNSSNGLPLVDRSQDQNENQSQHENQTQNENQYNIIENHNEVLCDPVIANKPVEYEVPVLSNK